MKTAIYIFILLTGGITVEAQQFYLRGEVKDESGLPLQNVTILQHSTGFIYKTGNYGSFGIVTNKVSDTLTFSLNGYQKNCMAVNSEKYQAVQLKRIPTSAAIQRRDRLSSLTKDLARETQKKWYTGEESYASLIENKFIEAAKYPSTNVSLNIDRASYSNVRRFINMKTQVPPDAVRLEEMLNYFNIAYESPQGEDVFNCKTILTESPLDPEKQFLFVNISSRKLDLEALPPSHFVFLIDVSGSMDMPNRLPLLKSAFKLLVNNLREKDTVSIVVYGGVVGIMLQPTSGAEKEKIRKAIDELSPGGSTPGESGVRLAYNIAKNNYVKNGNNRVILATDGDFNVGAKTEIELEELITQYRDQGIYLTCFGVGMGNYKDSKIQTLSRKGNGNFAYFDNFHEAEKVLLKEFTQTLYAVADDVYMSISFNPNYVKEYRLMGFENKLNDLSDTTTLVEGGEIGSGYSVMAVFEIVPTIYNLDAVKRNFTPGNLASIKIHYTLPNQGIASEYLSSAPLSFSDFNAINRTYKFLSSVIMFGSLLRNSELLKNIDWNNVLALALDSSDPADASQKEFIGLVQAAKSLYSKQKKKKERVRKTSL